MLWRRCDPQAQAPRKAKGRQKRMRQFGKVEIPQSAFIAALKMGDG
jgi:translation elongation factor EF-4